MDEQNDPQFQFQTPDDVVNQQSLPPSYPEPLTENTQQSETNPQSVEALQAEVEAQYPQNNSPQIQQPEQINTEPLVATQVPLDPAGESGNTVFTGLSGNELYCMNLVGYRPGNLIVGNSVYSIGFIGSMLSNIKTKIGGEIVQFTNMISGGRKLSLQRLEKELSDLSGHGATGVSSELVFHPGNIEFLSIGSTIYRQDNQSVNPFTSSSDGQELFCQMDAGYQPLRFVLGNVAYSIGIGRNFLGEIKEMVKGEIKQYSDVFNITRNLALERITQEAKESGANSIIGIRTSIVPIGPNGVHEMVMIGTASFNDQVSSIAQNVGGVITSDLTAEETWNISKLGYVPMKLILGTSVYSLGVVGGLRAAVRGFIKGEITTLTQLIYGAREQSLKKVQEQAQQIGADDVLGIKTYIYQLNGDVIEFLAIGTAVKKVTGIQTRSDQIPPQAIIRDKNTFINTADQVYNTDLNQTSIDHQNQKNTV